MDEKSTQRATDLAATLAPALAALPAESAAIILKMIDRQVRDLRATAIHLAQEPAPPSSPSPPRRRAIGRVAKVQNVQKVQKAAPAAPASRPSLNGAAKPSSAAKPRKGTLSVEAVVAVLTGRPAGLRPEALREQMGLKGGARRRLAALMSKLVASGVVLRKGEKRATTYWLK